MIPDTRVAVIGLGLMGGSLARALAARGVRVLGYDSNWDHLAAAVREGVVHEELDSGLAGLETAEVVLLAVPVSATVSLLSRIAPWVRTARLIMDVASTKRTIIAAAETAGIGACYVGAHPLTGSHRSGWGASRASGFRGSSLSRPTHPRPRATAVSRTGSGCPQPMKTFAHDSSRSGITPCDTRARRTSTRRARRWSPYASHPSRAPVR